MNQFVYTKQIGLTSTVIQKYDTWYEKGLLYPHESIRIDLLDLQSQINHKNFDPFKYPKQMESFFKYYNFHFFPFLHLHHEGEEEIYFPWVEKKKKLPGELYSEHKDLLQELQNVTNCEKLYKEQLQKNDPEGNKNFLETLRKTFSKMEKTMNEHLAKEEKELPGILKENFTKEEEDVVINKLIDHTSKLNWNPLPFMYNSIIRWGGQKEADEFYYNLPLVARMLYYLIWDPAFKENRELLLSITKTD